MSDLDQKTAVNYLRPRQVADFEMDRTMLEDQLRNDGIEDKGQVRQQLNRLNRQLEEQTPPDLNPGEREKADKERQELEADIQTGMPSGEEMRRCPTGTVDRHRAWERKNKRKILRWKNIKLLLNKGDDGPDLANVEQLRSLKNHTAGMDGALVDPRVFSAPSAQYQQNYDQINFDTEEMKRETEALTEERDRLLGEIAVLQSGKGTPENLETAKE